MALEMKELKGRHIFPILSILGKLEVKEDFVALFKGDSKKKKPQDHKKKKPTKSDKEALEEEIEARGVEIVADLIQRVLMNAGNAQDDINELFADLTDKKKSEIEDLNIQEYGDLIKGFFNKPELRDFFKQLASFMK